MRRWLDPSFQSYADLESNLQKLRPLYLYLGADVTRLDACISETQALRGRGQARELPPSLCALAQPVCSRARQDKRKRFGQLAKALIFLILRFNTQNLAIPFVLIQRLLIIWPEYVIL